MPSFSPGRRRSQCWGSCTHSRRWGVPALSLTPPSLADAGQLAAALKARLAPASQAATLVSLQNEFFLDGSAYPFNVQTGSLYTDFDIIFGPFRTYISHSSIRVNSTEYPIIILSLPVLGSVSDPAQLQFTFL